MSTNNLSESINRSLNAMFDSRAHTNFHQACQIIKNFKRAQIETVIIIRRLNLPSKSSTKTLVSHVLRYQAQKRLNDVIQNQRTTHSQKINTLIQYGIILGSAAKDTEDIIKSGQSYTRWYNDILQQLPETEKFLPAPTILINEDEIFSLNPEENG